MIDHIIKKIFWDPSEKKVRILSKQIEKIHNFEKQFQSFSQEDIITKTKEFQKMFQGLDFENEQDSQKISELLDSIKCEAFALVKTACKLISWKSFSLSEWKTITWNMIPYDVQLIWWLAIHEGNISEMKTWEWKTLVATLPCYLNALTGNPVHVVTVNDYLAKRDSEEMSILYSTLWLTTGVVYNAQNKQEKQAAYSCNIVYATNNELGFDYLRDNMVISLKDKVQSRLFFAVIDEVDSILIDEARTPLIISAADNEPTTKYVKFAQLIQYLENKTHYKIDEKMKTATLTEEWIKKVEELLHIDNIFVSDHYNDIHHIENALKAIAVYKKDKDYLVINNEVQIIDEHTGRVLAGRRYSEWLHQALEAKEKVEIQQESKTLASITFQNYFRMYWKLAGMTGTALTEAEEFYKVYSLDTLVIPTNKPIAREDRPDLLFKNEKWKFDYVVNLIKELHKTGQPILVGTVSVEKSEYLSQRLAQEKIPHEVLNAKQHEKEAEIVAKAGQKWAITIATNMAGRGTDIKLWADVIELGGLIILGTEKHETRRIDNQLRGRAWRQGDPWITQFLISPNDEIMRIFGGDKLFWVFNSPMFASLPDDEPLSQSWMLTKRVTWVQKQVEGYNFDARKHVLEYDDVINKHRSIIYSRRNKILSTENIDQDVQKMVESQIQKIVIAEFSKQDEETKDHTSIIEKVNDFLDTPAINDKIEIDDVSGIADPILLSEYIQKIAIDELDKIKSQVIDINEYYNLEKRIVLQSIDELWMRHIDSMSKLREEVAFEWYAQRNPLIVYKEKAYEKFTNLIAEIEYKVVKAIFSIRQIPEVAPLENREQKFTQTSEKMETQNKPQNPLFNQTSVWSENNSTTPIKIRI